MLIRIVRMHFTPSGVSEFLKIFNANRTTIAGFPGCLHLDLLRDLDNDLTYTTLSHWADIESLERYRQSELFASVWRRVKPLFSEGPQAFSLTK